MRLDAFLVEKFHFTKNRAQQLIRAELILVNEQPAKKAGQNISSNDIIRIIDDKRIHWVSRSAQKLHDFFQKYPQYLHNISQSCCLDVGASTGGFTQVLLEHGAQYIDAVDVGSYQLHPSLKNHPFVHSFEQTDIRHFSSNKKYDYIVCDASFIALEKIFPSIKAFGHKKTIFILLFKPQFEVEKHMLSKNGVPKDTNSAHNAMLRFEYFLQTEGMQIIQKEKSSLLGEAGNQEWLYCIKNLIPSFSA